MLNPGFHELEQNKFEFAIRIRDRSGTVDDIGKYVTTIIGVREA